MLAAPAIAGGVIHKTMAFVAPKLVSWVWRCTSVWQADAGWRGCDCRCVAGLLGLAWRSRHQKRCTDSAALCLSSCLPTP